MAAKVFIQFFKKSIMLLRTVDKHLICTNVFPEHTYQLLIFTKHFAHLKKKIFHAIHSNTHEKKKDTKPLVIPKKYLEILSM